VPQARLSGARREGSKPAPDASGFDVDGRKLRVNETEAPSATVAGAQLKELDQAIAEATR
jgi:hypothetical protein